MNAKEQRILENLHQGIKSQISEKSDENISLKREYLEKWALILESLLKENKLKVPVGFEKAQQISENIINYMSAENKNFNLMDLLTKCEVAKIPDYIKILNPTKNNFVLADDETLTEIVRLYDENLIVKNGIIANSYEENSSEEYKNAQEEADKRIEQDKTEYAKRIIDVVNYITTD